MDLPEPRGPLSAFLIGRLQMPPHPLRGAPAPADGPEDGEDFHLSLYLLYEIHYRALEGVDEAWEWEPSRLAVRGRLEGAFEAMLLDLAERRPEQIPRDMDLRLREVIAADDAPPLSRFFETRASLEQARELLVHRSAFNLKEADPHSWAIPRLEGAVKAALVEIQTDEYGGGRPERMHALLYARALEAVGLDPAYGAQIDAVPGVALATVNLMSLFGLHRRWRGALVGHLAGYEMSSPEANRRYANGLRRLGFEGAALEFFDEHVEADSVHENIAANEMAGGLARESPDLAGDVLFGARALFAVDGRFARHVMAAWGEDRSSLRGSARLHDSAAALAS